MLRFFIVLFALTTGCPAAGLAAENERLVIDGAWQEALVSVRDLDDGARFFLDVAGYRVRHRGRVDPRQLEQWRLPGSASAEALLLAQPGSSAAYVRLIEFSGVRSRPIRATARAWDTGGYYSLMVRGEDIGARLEEAFALGWSAESDPVEFDFGRLRIANIVLEGPDGLNVAVYERISPPLEGWPKFGRLTRPFNAMQMVRDAGAATHFYRNVLGFETWWEGDYLDPAPASNNFGIPQNYVTRIPRRTRIFYPVPGETGRVEVMQFVGFEGRDLADRATPPNLGILSLRFPVSDLAARLADIREAQWPVAYGPSTVTMPPYGEVESFAVRSPDGAMIEFIEPGTDP